MVELASGHPEYFLRNWWSTFSVASFASLVAFGLAIILSILALRFRTVRLALSPFVAASQSFPLQAIAPLVLVALGIGFFPKVFIALIIAFFPIYSACATALQLTPAPLLAHARICRAPFMRTIRLIRIPAALPLIISAAKVGFTLAVLGAVVAEFIQPNDGLGAVLLLAQGSNDVETIYLCVACLIIQGLGVFLLLSSVEGLTIHKGGK